MKRRFLGVLVLILGLSALPAPSQPPAERKGDPLPKVVTSWWQNKVIFVPDSLRGGETQPGLAGNLYLHGEDLATTLHYPGRAVIDLYDITPRPGAGPEPVFLQRTAFTPEVLKALERNDPAGKVYKLYVPWQTYRPGISRVELRVAFQPTDGKRTLIGEPVRITLAQPEKAAAEPQVGFLNKVFKGDKGDSKYVVFVPHDYKGDREYPLILFLHGAGERGDDGEAPVKQGIGNAIKFKGQEAKFPFLVVFPQCARGGNWKAGGPDADRALAILAEVQKAYKVDPKRVYLSGLSMGGGGTWSLAAAYPDKWAAIAPICGGGDPTTAEKFKHLPCWAFCGDKDAGALDRMRTMVKALKDAGGEPRYSEFPYVGHNSWDSAYVTPELYSWLLSHKLK